MLLTVRRAGEVLDLFRHQGEWGVSAVADELDIARSQAHEVLTSLCQIGLVRRLGRGRYRLGWGTVSLGRELLRSEFRGSQALPVRRLAAVTRQAVHLVALDRSQMVVLAGCTGEDGAGVSSGFTDGELERTAAGRLLLALQGEGVGTGPLTGSARRIAPEQLTALGYAEAPEDIARRGIATDLGESRADRRGVAAPVVQDDGNVLAALSLTTTPERWANHEREYTILVRREAAALSRGLRQTPEEICEAEEVA